VGVVRPGPRHPTLTLPRKAGEGTLA
jgi:hypothetical protein